MAYKIIIFKEKHDNKYYIAQSVDDCHKIMFRVMMNRVKDGYWYEGTALNQARTIADKLPSDNENIRKDVFKEASRFMQSRQYEQYEDYEFIDPEIFI